MVLRIPIGLSQSGGVQLARAAAAERRAVRAHMGWFRDLWKYGPTASIRERSRETERYVQRILAYYDELATMPNPAAKLSADQILAASITFA